MLTHHVRHAHTKAWHTHAILHGHHWIEAVHGAEIHVAEALLVLVEAEPLLSVRLCAVLLLLLLRIVSSAVLLVLRLGRLGFWSFSDDLHVTLIGRVFIIDAFFGLVFLGWFHVALLLQSASAREGIK